MTFSVHGLAVARGIAIGRAVLVASSRVDVAHYFVKPEQVEGEIERVRNGRNAVVEELQRLQTAMPADAPHELTALLDVHLMLLQDEALTGGVKHWITERLYNAEWALTTQLEVIARQFDEMEDEYLRERKADLEQVVERILRYMKGVASPVAPPPSSPRRHKQLGLQQDLLLDDTVDVPLVLVAHDLSPADMLQFKQSVFAGFVTDVGGKTSHTAIVARSMDIPAVVGARAASQLVRQDDWVIIDGDAGVVIVDPSPIILAEYGFRQRQVELERERLARLRHTPAITIDGHKIELLANIEQPGDAAPAVRAGAVGVGLFRSEFLFMGKTGNLPGEDEQYRAYCEAIDGMQGLPVTIPTIDVGADKPLEPGRPGHVPHPAARCAACGGAWQGQPVVPHAGAHARNSADARPGGPGPGGAGCAWRTLRPGAAGRNDRGARRRAHGAHLPQVLRLSLHRHQRPDPVHPGHRPCRRGCGPSVRPAAPRRAAPGGRRDRRGGAPGQERVRVWRDGGRCDHDAPAVGPGPAQLLHAPRADPGCEAGGAAR